MNPWSDIGEVFTAVHLELAAQKMHKAELVDSILRELPNIYIEDLKEIYYLNLLISKNLQFLDMFLQLHPLKVLKIDKFETILYKMHPETETAVVEEQKAQSHLQRNIQRFKRLACSQGSPQYWSKMAEKLEQLNMDVDLKRVQKDVDVNGLLKSLTTCIERHQKEIADL